MLNSVELKFLKYIYNNKKVSYDELLKFSKYSNRDVLDTRISPLIKYISVCENDSLIQKVFYYLKILKKKNKKILSMKLKFIFYLL